MSTSLSPSSSLDILSSTSHSTRWATDSLSDEDEIVWSLSSSAILSSPSPTSPLSESADYVLVPRIDATPTPPATTATATGANGVAGRGSSSVDADDAIAITDGMAALSLSGASSADLRSTTPGPTMIGKESEKNGRAGAAGKKVVGVSMPPVIADSQPSTRVPAPAVSTTDKQKKKAAAAKKVTAGHAAASSRHSSSASKSSVSTSSTSATTSSSSSSSRRPGDGPARQTHSGSRSAEVTTPKKLKKDKKKSKKKKQKQNASDSSLSVRRAPPAPARVSCVDVLPKLNANKEGGEKEPEPSSTTSSGYHEAHKFMTSYLAHPPPPGNNGSALLMLQALILELGCLPSAAAAGKFSIPELPGTMRQAKLLLKSHAFINVRDYLAVREQGQAALRGVMHSSRKSLVREVRKGKRVPVKEVKKAGLNILLVNTRS